MIQAQIYKETQVKITMKSVSLYVVIYFTLELIILKCIYFLTQCEHTMKITLLFVQENGNTKYLYSL
jgi:hypothetical protein